MKGWTMLGCALLIGASLAACSDDKDDNPAPEATPDSIDLQLLGRYSAGEFAVSAAEIPAFDPLSKRIFVVNARKGAVDVLDGSDPAEPEHIQEISSHDIAANSEINSIALHDGVLAVAIQAAVKTDPGFVAFYRASDLHLFGAVEVGALPDMLTFTPDGKVVLVANEGEPSDDYQIDPEGSVSVIDVSDLANLDQSHVRTATFHNWDDQAAELRAAGVRIFGPGASVSRDMEPEYIAVSEDGSTAWVALQENNALARLDVASATITDIFPLGYKDHGVEGNGLDVSDTESEINIRTWPGLRGMYHPDGIATYSVGGQTYIVTANEGDARAWGENTPAYFGSAVVGGRCNNDNTKGFVEEWRVKHLVHHDGFDRRCGDDLPAHLRDLAAGAMLNPDVFGYCKDGETRIQRAGPCREDDLLGRLTITWTKGYQTWEDGTPKYYTSTGEPVAKEDGNPLIHRLMYDELYAFGGRSFSIFSAEGERVWDSGDQFERYLAGDECRVGSARSIPCKDYFNSNHEEGDGFDDRSDNKGPEPEGVALGRIGDKTFAFIGLERMGGVMIYDITDPQAPFFVNYVNSRENWEDDPATSLATVGDLGPEGLVFVAAQNAPGGEALLIVGNEVSGTTAVYRVTQLLP